MKRRQALHHIALISSGIALLPACDFEDWPSFDKLGLEKNQLRLVEAVCKAILPEGKEDEPKVKTPEPAAHFVLGMVNDCFQPGDRAKYVSGLKLFEQYVLDEYAKPFKGLNPQQHILLFTEMSHSSIFPKSLKYFLDTTKQLTVRHFITSEYFMTQHLKFEFAPGRFKGCVTI